MGERHTDGGEGERQIGGEGERHIPEPFKASPTVSAVTGTPLTARRQGI
jgi:hypothetical protein